MTNDPHDLHVEALFFRAIVPSPPADGLLHVAVAVGVRFHTAASWDNRGADGPSGSVGFDMGLAIHHWVTDSVVRVALPADMPFLADPPLIHRVSYDDGSPTPVNLVIGREHVVGGEVCACM